MEQTAKPGSTLITAAVLALAEGYIQVKSLGLVPVKGLATPVDVYEAVDVGPVRTRLQAAVARGLTRFVGRAPELDTLHQALARAGAGHGRRGCCPTRAGAPIPWLRLRGPRRLSPGHRLLWADRVST